MYNSLSILFVWMSICCIQHVRSPVFKNIWMISGTEPNPQINTTVCISLGYYHSGTTQCSVRFISHFRSYAVLIFQFMVTCWLVRYQVIWNMLMYNCITHNIICTVQPMLYNALLQVGMYGIILVGSLWNRCGCIVWLNNTSVWSQTVVYIWWYLQLRNQYNQITYSNDVVWYWLYSIYTVIWFYSDIIQRQRKEVPH